MTTLIACILIGGLVPLVACVGLGIAGAVIRLRIDAPVRRWWEFSDRERAS